ncbi:energy-coupling factor ABC transporter ATP-binding protein [Leucobacter ruminantium]|uniref:ABC transporter ATP-binding protein n=1 Tax=Leucobacter ruminantium TaxID=1289170 RepID=A0A939S008_9MICO|nr:ABC transporter ATP-binding protein [Leucobacter ruminantium]MBO1806019.1 ABC transporter ATP-binding protein [Leucobacter ruminantium]
MIELHEAGVVVSAPEGDTTILHPTSLALAECRISVIGGNGSGKSTLARLFNGLIEPSTGRVLVSPGGRVAGGRGSRTGAAAAAERAGGEGSAEREGSLAPPLDTARDGAAVRRAVGFVFTDASAQLIMPTVEEDVALSLRRAHPRKAERLAAARAVLERFGLEGLAERSVHTLSGGQKQLLAIATVLATDPAILVADEPTTLLDLRNARMIGELLMSLPQQVIVVTHDLELAARADRTLVVESGRVVFDGPPVEAIAHYRDRVAQP